MHKCRGISVYGFIHTQKLNQEIVPKRHVQVLGSVIHLKSMQSIHDGELVDSGHSLSPVPYDQDLISIYNPITQEFGTSFIVHMGPVKNSSILTATRRSSSSGHIHHKFCVRGLLLFFLPSLLRCLSGNWNLNVSSLLFACFSFLWIKTCMSDP